MIDQANQRRYGGETSVFGPIVTSSSDNENELSGHIPSAHTGISVVVCTHERHESLLRTLDCLLMQETAGLPGYEILVIDNSPHHPRSADLASFCAAHFSLRYLTSKPAGLSRARNVGLHHASYSVVAYVDDDVIVPRKWAGAMFNAFAASGLAISMVGGKVELAWPHPRPTWLHEKCLAYFGKLDMGLEFRAMRADEHPIGCNMAFDKETLLQMGGFDRKLGRMGSASNLLSNEELQVAQLLQKAGKTIYYAPEAVLEHVVEISRMQKEWFRRRFAWQAASDVVLGGKDLRRRKVRALIRKLTLPLAIFVCRKMDDESPFAFYLELESLYDTYVLRNARTVIPNAVKNHGQAPARLNPAHQMHFAAEGQSADLGKAAL